MEIVFATHNLNKLEELQAIFSPNIKLISLTDIGCEEDIPETSDTISGNALQKARYVKEKYGMDCFADDTGLEADALNGAPGVFSARYAGESKNDSENIKKLMRELEGAQTRKAQFKTVIAYVQGDQEHLFTGICKGVITEKIKGSKGFGYDPVFRPDGHNLTFGEMSSLEKADLSHRAKAAQQLYFFLSK